MAALERAIVQATGLVPDVARVVHEFAHVGHVHTLCGSVEGTLHPTLGYKRFELCNVVAVPYVVIGAETSSVPAKGGTAGPRASAAVTDTDAENDDGVRFIEVDARAAKVRLIDAHPAHRRRQVVRLLPEVGAAHAATATPAICADATGYALSALDTLTIRNAGGRAAVLLLGWRSVISRIVLAPSILAPPPVAMTVATSVVAAVTPNDDGAAASYGDDAFAWLPDAMNDDLSGQTVLRSAMLVAAAPTPAGSASHPMTATATALPRAITAPLLARNQPSTIFEVSALAVSRDGTRVYALDSFVGRLHVVARDTTHPHVGGAVTLVAELGAPPPTLAPNGILPSAPLLPTAELAEWVMNAPRRLVFDPTGAPHPDSVMLVPSFRVDLSTGDVTTIPLRYSRPSDAPASGVAMDALVVVNATTGWCVFSCARTNALWGLHLRAADGPGLCVRLTGRSHPTQTHGRKDGSLDDSMFHGVSGLALHPTAGYLLAADARNYSMRRVELPPHFYPRTTWD